MPGRSRETSTESRTTPADLLPRPATSPNGVENHAEARPIRVLVADDHPIVRAGVRWVLEGDGRFILVGEATSGEDAVHLAQLLQPDVVLIALDLPRVNGVDAIRAIKAYDPAIRLLIISMLDTEDHHAEALDAGADGYLERLEAPRDLGQAILRLHQGDNLLHIADAGLGSATGSERSPAEMLSDRERQILVQLAEGATSKEIGRALGLAAKTIENHRARILDKLGVANSAAAVRAAIARGLLHNRM